MEQSKTSLRQIALIGNYLPRQCGIATFTTDLHQALDKQFADTNCFVLAMNDNGVGYKYPSAVRFELAEQDLSHYRRAADFLNVNNVDLVSLQHEYGIFGGRAGNHILALLRELRMPVVTTLHTILRDPDPYQRQVLEEIARLSDRLVVMSERGSEFLQDIYHVPADRIDIIPHGIPDTGFIDPNFYKDQFGVEGRQVLLTFGLLSPNKGIEYVIQALPEILRRHPDVVYMILGATHPHVKNHEGESYRLHLQRLAREKGCRVEDRRGPSHFCAARSTNGVDGWQIDPQPTLLPDPHQYPEELWGIEDPRITYVPELGKHVIVYPSYSRSGPGVSLALTEDFRTFERCGVVMPPEDKDAALLLRKYNGRWVLLHRSSTALGAHIWVSYSPDLRHWGHHKILLPARRGAWWDTNKIGLGPPPIETSDGWLVIYHGVRQTPGGCLYRLGLALLDLDNPERCLLRGDSWIFGPEALYEREGDVDNVVFPCGFTVADDGYTVNLYYGAADT